jgi:hypothetical protein
MKQLLALTILIGAALLVGCAAMTPKDYGFRPVLISGADYFCAPREWVVPPIVPQDAAGDPEFSLYDQFLTLPDRYIDADGRAPIREVCITQAQWPEWLMMRNQWNRDWSVTPQMAEERAAQRAAGL